VLAFGANNTDVLSSTITDLNWHHYAVTHSATTNVLNLYIDGVLRTTTTITLAPDGPDHLVKIGTLKSASNNTFSGKLDEVRIYNRALSQAEIQTDMATPITPPDTIPPSDVTGLTATAVSATQINLSWAAATDNVGVTGYRVERCQGAGCSTFAQIATSAGTTFGDTSLIASTPYSYRVKAVDAGTNVSVNYSNEASATTQAAPPDTTPPSDVTGLTATAVGSNQINLAWAVATDSGGSGLAGYRVERCQGAGCSTFAQIATPSTNSYSDPGLTTGTSYSYRVKAVDGATNVSVTYSNTASATAQAVTNLITALGMNEGSGTTLADASGNGHTGTLVNGPAWVAGQATYGQALSFDGVNDAVAVANPSALNFGTSDFTFEVWVKRNLLGGQQRHLLSKCDNATWGTGCKELYFKASNQLALGSNATGDTLSVTIADTNWHHVAVTFVDATNTLSFYVDGTLRTTATKALEADGASHLVTIGNHLLGGLNQANAFSGLLDEVRIYNRALSQAEIQTDMATPITP
jgi:fibronectin type 3 domain-containing protein